jgi:hypothetical protein
MHQWIELHPLFSVPVCVGLIIALLALFIWKESRSRRHLSIRIGLGIVVIIAIAGIIFQPSLAREKKAVTILLTRGYDAKKADSLKRSLRGVEVFFMYDAEPFRGGTMLPSFRAIGDTSPDYVLGEGLPYHAAALLDSASFIFLPAENDDGIQEMVFPRDVRLNRPYDIEGIFQSSQPTTLRLYGPDGAEDSVIMEPGRRTFKLSCLPKATGPLTYEVLERTHSGESRRHKLPVNVTKPRVASVLILQGSPTFEVRDLKNYLGSGNAVSVRYQLSRSIYRYEFLNTKQQPLNRITPEILLNTDLLVIDTDALRTLNNNERRCIDDAVVSGLGVLVLFNDNPSGTTNDLLKSRFVKTNIDSIVVTFAPNRNVSLPVWSAAPENRVAYHPVFNTHPHTVAGASHRGAGKIGFALWKETYPLLLSGDSVTYGLLWAEVFESLSRVHRQVPGIRIMTPSPLYPDEPLTIQVKSPGDTPSITYNGAALPMKEDELIDDLWYTTVWPDGEGWQSIVSEDDSAVFRFYVHAPSEWRQLRGQQMLYETLGRSSDAPFGKQSQKEKIPINRVYFFIAFLTGMGLLWLVPKLS